MLIIDAATRPCWQWYGDSKGWISSPVTPHCSAVDCNGCTSILYVAINQTVQLRFSTFSLSTNEYVELREGTTASDPLIGRYTSRQRPPRVVEVAGNKIFIVFHSTAVRHVKLAFNFTFQPKGTCTHHMYVCMCVCMHESIYNAPL